jgi:hypothetical protein
MAPIPLVLLGSILDGWWRGLVPERGFGPLSQIHALISCAVEHGGPEKIGREPAQAAVLGSAVVIGRSQHCVAGLFGAIVVMTSMGLGCGEARPPARTPAEHTVPVPDAPPGTDDRPGPPLEPADSQGGGEDPPSKEEAAGTEADLCETAREGQPCPAGASYCVIDWGEPGGWSSALWCEGGRWVYEKEKNLE